jgi:hypothetical protein
MHDGTLSGEPGSRTFAGMTCATPGPPGMCSPGLRHMLQELGRWSSYEMVQCYAHLGAEHLAGYAANVSGPRLVVSSETNLIQSRKAGN